MLGGVFGIEKSFGVLVILVVLLEEKKCLFGLVIEEGVLGLCCVIFLLVGVCVGEVLVLVGRLLFIWWFEL